MLKEYSPIVQALLGTLFTWALTAAGAGLVVIIRGKQSFCGNHEYSALPVSLFRSPHRMLPPPSLTPTSTPTPTPTPSTLRMF
ncbi:hypothetical protein HZH68_011104 [Vespula germanica]|uniref:Uncharacterized protein n=1 Tax=Vespula germanica TaxID=30212 RepID=A0A834JU42_VESGE|nr:hypothetical protein HZH68_011104 [Vespula germanica]